jgi:hypothetical protein
MEKIHTGMAFKAAIDGQTDVDNHIEMHHDAINEAMQAGPIVPGTPEFCGVYKAARPILLLIKGMLFFKPKWQVVLTGLIAGLDAVCPDQ